MLQKMIFLPSNLAQMLWWSQSIYQAQELTKQREIDRTIVVSVENLRFFF